ncbi:MAG: PolC-type DNA polymerase III [Clostridia bacterium]
MDKKVKDVFYNLDMQTNLLECNIGEVKFSKKLNSVIVDVTSDLHITLKEISDFENKACTKYDLKSFKINYKYTGNIKEIKVENIKDILEGITNILPYTKQLFQNTEIIIDNKITIKLEKAYSKFLKIKKVDSYIKKSILTEFGKNIDVVIEDKVGTVIKENVGISRVKVDSIPSSEPKQNIDNSNKKETFNIYTKREPKPKFEKDMPPHVIIGRDVSTELEDKIVKLNDGYDRACIAGEICFQDMRKLKSGKVLFMIDVTDLTSTISCKMFLNADEAEKIAPRLKVGEFIKLMGKPQLDSYAKELTIMVNSIVEGIKPEKRKDTSKEKRVELHIHTQMSSMDGVSSAASIVKQAIKWGHKAVAITDHGVVQAFPEVHQTICKAFGDIIKEGGLAACPTKVLYGVEGYLVVDSKPQMNLPDTYCVFDLETTGFKAGNDKITEIAVVKVKNGKIIDEFSTFVNPERPIPKQVQEITHITEDMVENAPKTEEALIKFLEFTKDSILVAHNSTFDLSFITYFAKEYNLEVNNKAIDTLVISREIYDYYPNHKLGTIAEMMGISLEGAHRAINDARATAKVFNQMIKDVTAKGLDIKNYAYSVLDKDYKSIPYNHIIILIKNYVGLKNLYKIISFSHLFNFYKKPRITRSLLNRYKEGLIIGSACEIGELYQAIYNKVEESEIEAIAKYYDYLEIQPLGNNQFYIDNGKVSSKEDLININKKIIELGEKLNIPVVATTDAHFLNPEDEIYRRIIMSGQGYTDADKQAPLYYRTTDEMREEFSYLSKEKIEEIVVTNTNKIADMCEAIQPVVDGTYPPTIEGSEDMIKEISYGTARSIYGDNLPEIVEKRLEKELVPIIKYGFAVMYIIAMKLVKKSNEDGYLVGSRGSVGSSFVATMTGITEVNPLPPHYICSKCKYSEFPQTTVTTGIDMEDKNCPNCNIPMKKNGMDIPFETFLGFKGDKAPDIDLNFSGDNQASAHAYTEVLFGKGKTFRAGTIGTIADKTAFGFVKKYYDAKGVPVLMPEVNRLSRGCTGIKRTTGQHPGGIIVVPADKEIYDFCPIQKPADDMFSKSITTHFDFHSIHDNLLKLDILGHDDPTVIRMLQDLTGIDPHTIPLDEPKVMSLFSSTKALEVTPEQINSETGTFAVPEFGTKFVRQMLVDTKPTTFGELVRISGLSHGTDVWLGNAQTLIENKQATLKETICTRDDIMIYLIQMGEEPSIAFKTMESVRKGKGLTEEMEAAMNAANVADWYVDSCKKIKYMFPKAHAAAYVMMAYRIAYFKVYYKVEFYATYLSVRATSFISEIMLNGKEVTKKAIKEYEIKEDVSQTDKDTLTVLEVINEMYERNIEFLPVDIYISDSVKFLVENGKIRPPLTALTGFGGVDSDKLVEARKNYKFESIEDVQVKAKLGKVSMEVLEKAGCFEGMPKSSQMNFLDM